MAVLAFGAWAQTGIGAAIRRRDDGGADLGVAQFVPGATIVDPVGQRSPVSRSAPLRMIGPGAVARLDPQAVVRAVPAPGSADSAANDLAAVELIPPELPWVLTPASGQGGRRLRPWLVLVVVDAAVAFEPATTPLPVLHAPVAQLPDLAQSWAWAHTQGPPGGPPAFARLLCPRKLEPGRGYRACLVPATRGGRLAGLSPTGAGADEPGRAWEVADGGEVALPVYYSWEFGTAPGGDFEDLVRRLGPAEDVSALNGIEVDLRRPWPGADSLTGTDGPATLLVSGAVRPLGSGSGEPAPTATPLTPQARQDFVARLSRQVDQPANLLAGLDPDALDDTVGAVSPPIYGGRHALVDRVEANPELPLADLGWTTELNLDPVRRIAAGLGAQYVRRHQETLMARAWEQVGAIREANRRRAMAELASHVAGSLHRRHVATLQPGELLAFAAPAAPRTPTGAQTTLALEMAASPLPQDAASTPFARALRPAGRLAQRSGTTMTSVVTRALRGEVTVPDPQPVLAPAVDPVLVDVSALGPGDAARQLILLDAARRVAAVNELGEGAQLLSARLATVSGLDPSAVAAGDVAAVAIQVSDRMEDIRELVTSVVATDFAAVAAPDGRSVTTIGVQISADLLAGRLVDALAPRDRHARRLASRVRVPAALDRPDLCPVMAYPTFPAPMALAMLAETPEWFLPGLGGFPPEKVTLLEADDAFIESYLVGLNHEFMSELLWREYPTDRRGSPFRRFWPRPADADVPELHTWNQQLGQNVLLQGEEFALVLVRGEVVRRFPDMVVSAVRAVLPGPPPTLPQVSTSPVDVRPTMFVVPIDAATVMYAVGVGPDELAAPMTEAAPGWFIVFQEHDYRMRFGFDISNDAVTSWEDLDWPTVQSHTRPGFADVSHVITVDPEAAAGLAWGPGSDSTQVARISLQAPFAVAIHANRLLRPRR
jgi:hypothetical protein